MKKEVLGMKKEVLGEKCCENVSNYGYLECLKYLHENGCP